MNPVPVEVAKSTRSVAVSRAPFIVPGFQTAAVASGMRYRDRPDLALIAAETKAVAAAIFTTNRFSAAPVQLCREHLEVGQDRIKAILINAGIANACTGEEGLRRAREMARMTADTLEVFPQNILVASTGVIGPQISLEPISRNLSVLKKHLRPDGWQDVAQAIMTTDTVPKWASAQAEIGGVTVTVGGVAKGSGMIAPNMATMLAFVCTDAAIEPEVLKRWVRLGAERSFNCITVDGDTSTNDTLIVLAGGRAENALIADADSPHSRLFGEALQAVLIDLARQIVYDGEGATKFIEIWVMGAPDVPTARAVAFTIANSPLVKTAFFGEDANWGRIIAAAGRAGVPLDPQKVALFFEDLCVFRNGTPVEGKDIEEKASQIFRRKEIGVTLDLGVGTSSFTVYTSDFSYDYVKINAAYRS